MGCTSSAPEAKADPEPVPTLQSLLKIKVVPLPGEPQLTTGEDNYTSADTGLQLIFRGVNRGAKGNSFQLENYHDELFHRLLISPAKPGLGIRNRMEQLVFAHYEGVENASLGFAIHNVPKGLNYFAILSPKPMHEGAKQVPFQGPEFCPVMYPYATIEFNIKTTVASVSITGHGKDDDPLYTMRQCNPKVWVIKRLNVGPCAAIERVRGIGKLSCYRVLYCAGTDPVFMGLLTSVIDAFLEEAKTQGWKFFPKNAPTKNINWPQLDKKVEEKLFGRGGLK